MSEVRFHFRAPSKKLIAENKEAGLPEPVARTAVIYDVPHLTAADLTTILQSGDEQQVSMLVDAANEVIEAQVRKQLDEQPNHQQIDLTKINRDLLSWSAIANMPKKERTSSAVSEETWEAFKADYTEVMQALTGKPQAVVENAAKIIAAEFRPVRDNKDKLAILETYLEAWFEATTKGDEFLSLYQRLSAKVKDFQNKGLASLEI